MDVVLDFGSEPVKDVDTKLQILKFSYSWIEEVESQERLLKEVTEPVLEDKDEQKSECQLKTLTTETKEIPREPVLDFGNRPAINLDEKLQILKFTYSWAERVEEEEKGAKEDNEPTVEQMNKIENESNVKILREERNEISREPILDFGEGPVTTLEEKLEILKFGYNWSEKVEEEERGTKMSSILDQTSQEDAEQQKVTEDAQAKQEIASDNVSKTLDMPPALEAEIGTHKKTTDLEATCSKMETLQIKSELLYNEEEENDNYFVPRKLFLSGVVEFKSDWKLQSNKNSEQSSMPEKKSTDALDFTNESVADVATVSISRKIKKFLGIR